MDDVLVHNSNFEDHLKSLREVFSLLGENNISINFNKSKFGQKSIKILGCVVDETGYHADSSRIHKIRNIKPKSKKKLNRILGLINWFRIFIPNVSLKCLPLTQKLKTNTTFSW